MNSSGQTTETRKALEALLRRLDIKKVVCVDDEHTSSLTLEDILGWLAGASLDDVAIIFPDFPGKSQTERDVRTQQFRAWWEKLENAEREEAASAARSKVQENEREDSPDIDYMSVLSEIFDGMQGIDFLPIDPKEWHKESEALLSTGDIAQTLFLFDQDMSKGDGRKNEGSLIIGDIFSKYTDPRPLCGILTHTIATNGQVARWEELAQEAGIDRDQFMAIPKGLLTDDLQEFTRQMKSAVLAPWFKQLKEASSAILSDALTQADRQLESLTVLDFDHMVMRVANGEGVWEGQILFRLYAHFHQLEAERRARSNENLSSLINGIRKVSDIPELGKAAASEAVRNIRHSELYEYSQSINQAHLDITTGDIFESPSADDSPANLWFVATQACDLAMRSAGERKICQGLLLRIKDFSRSSWEKNGKNQDRYVELEYFDTSPSSSKKAVDFLSATLVPSWMIETCVLSDSGNCGVQINSDLPSGLLPGWVNRYAHILAKAKDLIGRYNLSCIPDETHRHEVLARLLPPITSCGEVKATISGDHVGIPLQRVMRMRIGFAMEIVRQYSSYLGRTPHEVDLARRA